MMWKFFKRFFSVKNDDDDDDDDDYGDISFYLDEDDDEEEENPYANVQSFVTFMITKQGNIDLNISWDEDDDVTAKNLAILLHVLNSGGFEEHCASLLISIASQNPVAMSFVRKCIEEWNRRKKLDPLVKPSEVFQFGSVVPQEEEK